MIRTASAIEQVSISEQERLHDQHQSSIINQMLQKFSTMDLPERERVQCYMRHKWRLSHKPNSPVITSGVSENVRILVLTDKLIGLIKWRRQDWGTCSQSTCPKTRIREEGQQG